MDEIKFDLEEFERQIVALEKCTVFDLLPSRMDIGDSHSETVDETARVYADFMSLIHSYRATLLLTIAQMRKMNGTYKMADDYLSYLLDH